MRIRIQIQAFSAGLGKDINRYVGFGFLNFDLEFLKRIQSFLLLDTKIHLIFSLFGRRLYRFLSSYWLAHFYLMKKFAKVLHNLQCCGSGSGIRDWVLFDPWIRDPE
jgi:hypothetical protein